MEFLSRIIKFLQAVKAEKNLDLWLNSVKAFFDMLKW